MNLDFLGLLAAAPSKIKDISTQIDTLGPELEKIATFLDTLSKLGQTFGALAGPYGPAVVAASTQYDSIYQAAKTALDAHKTAVAGGADPTQSAITMGATISQAVVASGVVKDPATVAEIQTANALIPMIGMHG